MFSLPHVPCHVAVLQGAVQYIVNADEVYNWGTDSR